jgi:hypothetical protein
MRKPTKVILLMEQKQMVELIIRRLVTETQNNAHETKYDSAMSIADLRTISAHPMKNLKDSELSWTDFML